MLFEKRSSTANQGSRHRAMARPLLDCGVEAYDMRYFWRHLGWGMVAAPLALAGCSTDAPSSPPGTQPTGGQAGKCRLRRARPADRWRRHHRLDSIHGDRAVGVSRSGESILRQSSTLSTTIGGLPAGSGYTINITAALSDGGSDLRRVRQLLGCGSRRSRGARPCDVPRGPTNRERDGERRSQLLPGHRLTRGQSSARSAWVTTSRSAPPPTTPIAPLCRSPTAGRPPLVNSAIPLHRIPR